ncbi:FtsK/SpoIIIE domain-containing protein [Micromonospora chokoriensis]|uniref:DNA segregation ATPase FtsK/SpoIIIE, S-DNA-T family n=1 Tax=Micromonospora chokoriensis TaxID=356851 RepID=A0A1C4XD97_9ACTN|nr:FtsK/SpoIIIE domain-containing protein [Micromonospora chokoriensis]SCF06468.1 DNA segregation ATPase FtsK/SpoIIIE, S-DNA-T family [Micromonospora chokoriensis]
MRLQLTVADPSTAVIEYQVEAAPENTVGELAEALAARRPEPTGTPPAIFVAGAPLDPLLTLAEAPLRQGTVLGLDRPVPEPPTQPPGLVQVRVVSGTDAGATYQLDLGEHTIGTASASRVGLTDPTLAPVMASVRVLPDGRCRLRPEQPGLLLDRVELDGEQAWPPGGQLAVGSSLLELRVPVRAEAALQISEDRTGLDYNRPPRLLPEVRPTQFTLPSPPSPPERRPLVLITVLAPLVVSGAAFLITGNPLTLLFAILSPVALIAGQISSRRLGKASHRTRLAEYEAKRTRISAEAQAALTAERLARRDNFPDPAAVRLIAVGPERRLWERRRTDPDFLELRAGSADLPSEVVLRDPSQDEHRREVRWSALDVPATVSVRKHGVVGIAGAAVARVTARWMVAQAATLHSPEDLQIYLLAGAGDEEGWSWVGWLPHAAPRDGQDTVATVGADTQTMARRVAELSAVIAARSAERADGTFRDILVVLDGARRLRSLPGVTQILREGPAVGVYAICVDAEEKLLPEECQAVVAEQTDGSLLVTRTLAAPIPAVHPDLLSTPWLRTVARALAPLRDTGGADDGAALPDASRLLDVLGMEPPEPDAVAARWTTGGRTTEAVLGVSLDGPFALDLKRDGPHALVAGTTGSGKSELLQTLVASLAVANRPDAMTFVLVDYKGGSAFKDCVRLPHTVGMVTDLDTHLVGRALTSLTAELKRREHILAAAGAKDIDDYVDLLRREPTRTSMPRLLIVIDEFASMIRDLPDFVTGLVNIAQRGRSLGIHLVLATQRPGGVVSPEIRANTNLRIALRVTDTSESQDVLNAPDAASILKSTPGRAFVRLAQSSLVPFQAGRVGGFRPGARTEARQAPWLAPVSWKDLGRPRPSRPGVKAAPSAELTDLAVLVEAVRGASEQLAIEPPHSPWLPALPDTLTVDALPAPRGSGYHLPPVAYGLVDLPAEQEQAPLELDLGTLGHLHVIGSSRSGRSQALRTIAGTVAGAHSTADVHLYGVDCGNGALLALTELPHCGAVVQRTEAERLGRLFARLVAELGRRQQLLASTGSAGMVEYRAGAAESDRPPHILVLLDRFEVFDKTFADYDNGSVMAALLTLLREGAGAGIHVVMAGDRSMFTTRISSTTDDKLVLRLTERSDYSMVGINYRQLPDEIGTGRAIRAVDGAEAQIALLTRDSSGQGQARALAVIAEAARLRDAAVGTAGRPFRIDVLPDELTLAQASALARPTGPLWTMLGVGGDELSAIGPDLETNPSFILAGPPRSGRSTALLTMVAGLLAKGTPVVIAAPRRSPLRELAGVPGVLDLVTSENFTSAGLAAALAGRTGPAVVVLDDAEQLLKCDAGSDLGEIARVGAERGLGLIMGGSIDGLSGGFGGWHVDARRNRQGALLSPQGLGDGELIGVKLSRSQLGGGRPGRVHAHFGDGKLHLVQVPRTEPAGLRELLAGTGDAR